MPRAPRKINVRDIAGPGELQRELRKLAGVSPMTVWRWRNTAGFPRPVRKLKDTMVWDLAEVREWLAKRTEGEG